MEFNKRLEFLRNNSQFDWNDFFRSSNLSIDFIEKWSNGLVKKLVDKGCLTETKDSETNERFLTPNINSE